MSLTLMICCLGLARVCHPSTLRMVICPEASSAQNSMRGFGDEHGLEFDPALELLVQSLDGVRNRYDSSGADVWLRFSGSRHMV